MPDFVHLHSHTCYSTLDGAMSPEQYVQAVKDYGMKAAGLTDHGYLYGLPAFQKACNAEGIKPVLGCELYLVDSIARVREEKDRKRYHQLVIAKNEVGLQNLYRLASYAATEGFYYYPLIDFATLERFKEGLIVTSTCMSGILPRTLLDETLSPEERIEKACEIAGWYKERFGDDYYLEAHRHQIDEEEIILQGLPLVAKRMGIKVVAANDCHYVEEGDFTLQSALVCVKMRRTLDDTSGGMNLAHKNLFVKSPQQMVDLFPEFPNSAETTLEIADKVSAQLDLSGSKYHFPAFDLPPEVANAEQYLVKLCAESFPGKYPQPTEEVKQRVRHELNIINSLGFASYFLIVADIVRYARNSGVYVGPGRGSAAGSIVSYLLGITSIDPIPHDLLFERFLNPDRVSMPDIDIDFDHQGRQDVLDYIVKKYGEDHVANIVTLSTLKAKSGLQDFARVLGVDHSKIISATKKVPAAPKFFQMSLSEMAEEVEAISDLLESKDPAVQMACNLAEKAHGFIRHTGVHPAGIVITPGELEAYVPIRKDSKTGVVTTQFEGSFLDDLGLLKVDVLGLKTLSVIRNTTALIQAKDPSFNPEVMDGYDDPKTFELFARGDTLGIFQFESEGMQSWLKKLKPTSLNDLVAMNALYRPGPMDLIPNYVRRKHGQEQVDYPHELAREVLETTYGIIVYQEQAMRIAQRMAGYTMAEADSLRKAIGKKKVAEMNLHEDKFVQGSISNGVDASISQEVWDNIQKFAEYAFNKSHSLAYAILAYQTAYLKVHYPVEFMVATLENEDLSRRNEFVADAREQGINVLGPHVNISDEGFSFDEEADAIRYGLGSVKGVGSKAVKVLSERKRRGSFKSFYQFVERTMLHAGALKALIMSGALDGLGSTRASMFEGHDDLLKYLRSKKKYEANIARKPNGRFKEPQYNGMPDRPEWPILVKAFNEYEVSGAFVDGHPLDKYKVLIKALKEGTSKVSVNSKGYHFIPATIIELNRRNTRSGKPMWWVKIHDGEKEEEISMFKETFDRFGSFIVPEACLYLGFSYGSGAYSNKKTVEAAIPLEKVLEEWTGIVHLELKEDDVAPVEKVLDEEMEGGASVWIVTPNGERFCYESSITPSSNLVKRLQNFGRVSLA